jgi:hypothetical protein
MPGKKLKLSVEDLSVESFSVSEARDVRGTVLGHDSEAGTCNYSNCARTCTDMTDCFGACGGESQYITLICEPEFTWHVATCAYYATCEGYKHDMSCNWSCDPAANTCAAECG